MTTPVDLLDSVRAGEPGRRERDDRVVCARDDPVDAARPAVREGIVPVAGADQVGVGAFPAVEKIVSETADERVIARLAEERVVADAAHERVVAEAAPER